MDIGILMSAIFLLSLIFLVIAILWTVFTAFSKRSTIFMIVSIAMFVIPLWMAGR